MPAALISYYQYTLPLAPGCSEMLADQALVQAAIEFCNRTDLIQRIIIADCTINTADYTITPPSDMVFSRLLSVGWQGKALGLASPDLVTSPVVLRSAAIGTATPQYGDPQSYYQKLPSDPGFSLYPIPNATLAQGLTVKASFSPSNTATTLDDVLLADWVEAIAAGALARLMAVPGQPFTSSMAVGYFKQFNSAISAAKIVKNSGTMRGSSRVQPVRFA